MLSIGTYKDINGDLVTVSDAHIGTLLTWADGRTLLVADSSC